MRKVFGAVSLVLLLSASALVQGTSLYSNTTTFANQSFTPGGASIIGSDLITQTAADDITPAAGTVGLGVNSFTFSVHNNNGSTVSSNVILSFWDADGAAGDPGTLLATVTLALIEPTGENLFSFSQASPLFITPNVFWAGITFDNNNGADSISDTELNNLGTGLYDPPTAGSSTDVFFWNTNAGDVAVNNPDGGLFFFGGNPVANFGWSFDSDQSVAPEPSTFVMAAAGLGLAALLARRRRLS